MDSKEIKKQQAFLNCYKTLTDEQKLKLKELSLREMIMSCLVYGEDIFTSVCINACSEYYHRPYAEEYIDILGYDRVMEIYNDQKNYFDTKSFNISNFDYIISFYVFPAKSITELRKSLMDYKKEVLHG